MLVLGVGGAREGQMPGRATVQSLGGMGKTELALAYGHAFAWDYPGGRWQIPCEHVSDLRVALLHLANAKAFDFDFTEDEKKNVALAFERVLRELSRRERCLLILDNVSDPNLLQPEYLDRLPCDGRVDLIATTRLAPHAIPGSAQEQSFIAVDELPEEDALALMRSHQPEGRFLSRQEDDEARAIVRLLRGFTLAVETAAIYLGRDAAPEVCRRFRERLSPDLLRESEAAATDPAVAVRHRVRSLEETLAFTLQTLTPDALHLLGIASLLPADQIALSWLKTVGAEKFPASSAEQNEPNAAFRQAEELLLGLRLFQSNGVVDDDGRLLVVRMHRLVQQLAAGRAGLTRTQLLEKLVAHAETRCQFLHEGWLDWHNRWEIEPLRALAQELLAINHSRASILANEVAFRLHEIARDAEAEPLYRRALAIDEKAFGPNHARVASTLRDRAQLLQTTNRLAEAEPLMRRALAIHEQHPGSSHREVAKDLNALALLMQLTGRIIEAEKALRQALTVCERGRPETDRDLSSVLGNLALLLHQTRRLQDAEPLFRQALAIEEQNSGPDHFLVALRRHNLAALLKDTNRFNEAESLFRSAQRTWENYYGPEHPMVASAMNNLARLISRDGRVSEAECLLRRALAVDEQAFGSAHPAVARDLGNLGFLLKSTGRSGGSPLEQFGATPARHQPNVGG